jgi:hypothetical protein
MELSMRSYKVIPALMALALSLPARAQQSQPELQPQPGSAVAPVQPVDTRAISNESQGAVPAARGLFIGYDSQGTTAQVEEDTTPLSGAESMTLGTLHSLRTLFDPALYVSLTGDTGLSPGQIDTATQVSGSIALDRDWGKNRVTATYQGGMYFYRPASAFNGSYHNFGFVDAFRFGRWRLHVRDDALYSQAASFNGLDTGGFGAGPGLINLANVQPVLTQQETIATGQGARANNTVLGEADYALSHRASITFATAYSLLHFMVPGYIDTHNTAGIIGFDYALSPRNSVALSYSYDRNDFASGPGNAIGHTIQGSYGRRIVGQLALQFSGGPQIIRRTFGPLNSTQVTWTAGAALNYGLRLRHTFYSFSYNHGLSAGSGVLFGSEVDALTVSANYTITRNWSATMNAGYALNNSLPGSPGPSTLFQNWFAGTTLVRHLGRQFQINTTYEFARQTESGACPVVSCGIRPNQQSFGVTLAWHLTPPRVQ